MTKVLVRNARQFGDTLLLIRPIPAKKTRVLLYTDVSWENTAKGGNQGGQMVAAIHEDIFDNRPVDHYLMQWRSGRVRCVCVNTLAAETLSLVER